jgi:hypothetical protein
MEGGPCRTHRCTTYSINPEDEPPMTTPATTKGPENLLIPSVRKARAEDRSLSIVTQ